MTTIVGLDPSIRSPGLAVVRDNVLVAALRLKLSKETRAIKEPGARVDAVAHEISDWVIDFVGGWVDMTLVYEWPQIYGVGKSIGDPNDLLALAAIGAAVARDLRPNQIITPRPREWVGGTSKNTKGPAWDCTRGAKLRARLTEAELALIPAQHDALDAVGLALHATSRALATPRRVRSRGGLPESPSASPVRR